MKNDEYQFPKDEHLEQPDSNADEDNMQPPDEGDRRMAFLRNKKFLIGFMVFLIIVIGLKLMHHPKTVAPAALPTVQEQPVPVMAQSMIASPPPSAISDMQGDLSNIHNQLNSVVTANTQLTQSVSALTAQVTTLTAALQDTTQKLADITAKPVSGMRQPVYHPMPVTYVLKAVIPGRAWLLGSDGISVNMATGNYLSPYYGSIQSIDAVNGQVMTTKGKVIRYGSNDS